MPKTITSAERIQLIGLAAVIKRHNAAIHTVEQDVVEILTDDEHGNAMDHFTEATWDRELDPEEAVEQALERAHVTVIPRA